MLGNSLKFTSEGFIKIYVSYQDNAIITKIKDSGVGMKPDDLEKLFSAFGKLEDKSCINKNGLGLGLNICKNITQLLGGRIEV